AVVKWASDDIPVAKTDASAQGLQPNIALPRPAPTVELAAGSILTGTHGGLTKAVGDLATERCDVVLITRFRRGLHREITADRIGFQACVALQTTAEFEAAGNSMHAHRTRQLQIDVEAAAGRAGLEHARAIREQQTAAHRGYPHLRRLAVAAQHDTTAH